MLCICLVLGTTLAAAPVPGNREELDHYELAAKKIGFSREFAEGRKLVNSLKDPNFDSTQGEGKNYISKSVAVVVRFPSTHRFNAGDSEGAEDGISIVVVDRLGKEYSPKIQGGFWTEYLIKGKVTGIDDKMRVITVEAGAKDCVFLQSD